MKNRTLLTTACSSALILIWSYAGIEKLIRFEASKHAFRNQTFPLELADALAIWVPLTEILLAVFLMIPLLRWWGYLGSIMLLSVFNTYIGLIWVGAFPRVPCNCAGLLESLDWASHFWVNWGFLGFALAGLIFTGPAFSGKREEITECKEKIKPKNQM